MAGLLLPGPAESTLRREVAEDCLIDDWGVTWRRQPGTLYFEVAKTPLQHASLDDLDRYPWPNLLAPSRFIGLAEQARAIQQAGYATVLMSGVTLFEQAYLLRGLDTLLMDLAANEDFFTALMVKLKSLALPYLRTLLQHVGPHVDVLVTGDDLGMTAGPMMSPRLYRRLIKPHHADLLATIKKYTPGKVFFHSCGNVHALLGDLAEVGVDLLNPVQVSAGAMGDTARLKQEFGRRLSFCGAIDTQRVMPHGTPEEVRQEVRRRIKDLAPGGGYVAAAVHCLQPDVPPENIMALCEEVARAGALPSRPVKTCQIPPPTETFRLVMDKQDVIRRMCTSGVLPVFRTSDVRNLVPATRAIHDAGIACIEYTMTMPNALQLVREAAQSLPGDLLLGAGTIMDGKTVDLAVAAGAKFIASPGISSDMVEACRAQGVVSVVGAITPTEIMQALRLGVDVIKVFPAAGVGPTFFSEILGPFPGLHLMAAGGMTLLNVKDYVLPVPKS